LYNIVELSKREPFIIVDMDSEKNAEFSKDTVEVIESYKRLMLTLLKNKDKINITSMNLNIIKPNIFYKAYNPSNNFIGIGFKSDQA